MAGHRGKAPSGSEGGGQATSDHRGETGTVTERTFEQMATEAYAALGAILDDGEDPGEHSFLVTRYERILLLDMPPCHRSEMDLSRTTFFGMRISVKTD